MKNLIIYYSKTGKNKELAKELNSKIKAGVEEIVDLNKREGLGGFISGGFQAAMGLKTKIKDTKKSPKNYDLLVLLSPIWAGKITPALRTFIAKNKHNFKNYVFLSISSSGEKNIGALPDLSKAVGKKPMASLFLSEQEYQDKSYKKRLKNFVKNLNR